MPTRTVQIKITGENQAGGAFKQLQGDVEKTQGVLGNFTSALGSIPSKLATFGLAVQGFQTIVSGLKGLGDTIGIGLQMQMEDVRAQFMAFYKDAGKVETALSQVRAEAAATPFEFKEMATAAGALIPVSKAAGMGLMDMVKIAEVMAASNPAQGLEGAAFALREAVSGDFVSLIERFNLPRSYINKLKAEGVPNIEIVQRALKEMGFDADLVAAKAQTLAGRWSTFNDSIDTVKMTISQPIFDALKNGLIVVQNVIDNNQKAIQAWAQSVANGIQGAINVAVNSIKWLVYIIKSLQEYLSAGNQRDVMREWFGDFGPVIDRAVRSLKQVHDQIADVISIVRSFGSAMGTDNIIAWAGAWAAVERVMGEAPNWFHALIGSVNSVVAVFKGTSGLAGMFEGMAESIGQLGPRFDGLSNFLFQISENAADARGPLYGLASVFDTVFGRLTGTEGSKLGTPLQSLIGFIKGVDFGPIVQGALQVYQAFKSFTFLDNVIAFFKGFSEGGISGGINAVAQNITGAFATLQTTLGPIIQNVINWVSTQAPAVLAALQPWIQAFVQWASQLAAQAGTYLSPIIASLWAWIQSQAATLLQAFNTWIAAFLNWLPNAVVQFLRDWPAQFDTMLTALESGDFIPTLASWTEQFLQWVVNTIPQIIVGLAGLLLAIVYWIGSTAVVLGQHLITRWVPAFVDWIITKVVPLALEALANLLSEIVKWIVAAIPLLTDYLRFMGLSFVAWIVDTAIPQMAINLAKLLRDIQTWITNSAKSIGTAAIDMGKQFVTGFLNGIGNLGKQLTEKILTELRNINIDLGWIKISGGTLTFNFPSLTGSGSAGPTGAQATSPGAAPSVPQAATQALPGAGVQVVFEGPVYTMADFEDAVIQAVDQAGRRGRAVWVPA